MKGRTVPEERSGSSRGPRPARLEPAPTPSPSPVSPQQPFGASLEPVLHRACQGRLSEVSWFRTDWQRGGALTGYAVYQDDDDRPQPVVVKLPVPPVECLWLMRLQQAENVVPRLYAHGESLNGYDMAWLVMERLPHGPLGAAWGGKEFDWLVEAAGRFYAAAQEHSVTGEPRHPDWHAIYEQARHNVPRHGLAHEQRWKQALKKVHKKLPEWLKIWSQRPVDQWCHGDLHLANAMCRAPAPEGPAVLIDFALTQPGHWVEDAVYFEHLFWARRQRLGDRKLCSLIARQRKAHGLLVEADWPRFAAVRRGLMAMATPAMLHLDGSPPHVEAALQVLEAEVG